jgi:hypothetical protein
MRGMKTMNIVAASLLIVLTGCRGPSRVEPQPGDALQGPDGSFTLDARDAVVHGQTLRYEPQPNKDTLGYWTDPSDWAEWPVAVEKAGKFEVHVLQGCGEGQGGSEVRVSLGDDSLTFTVEDTGHFQNFKWRKVGVLRAARKGRYALQVHPIRLASHAVMDLRGVRLVPVR